MGVGDAPPRSVACGLPGVLKCAPVPPAPTRRGDPDVCGRRLGGGDGDAADADVSGRAVTLPLAPAVPTRTVVAVMPWRERVRACCTVCGSEAMRCAWRAGR